MFVEVRRQAQPFRAQVDGFEFLFKQGAARLEDLEDIRQTARVIFIERLVDVRELRDDFLLERYDGFF